MTKINIENIKYYILTQFTNIDIISNKQKISIDNNNCLEGILLPIYYLFDKDINEKIFSSEKYRDNMLVQYDINNILEININNIINISSNDHATIFYIFDNYFYYSNSGFGINNHLVQENKYVFPKLFKHQNIDIHFNLKKINEIIQFIIKYIENIYDILLFDEFIDKFLYEINKLHKDLNNNDNDIRNEVRKIIDYTRTNNIDKSYFIQGYIYTLIYYLLSNNEENIKECTFNDILCDSTPNIIYKLYIKDKNNKKYDLYELYLNAIENKNSKISNEIYNSINIINNNLIINQFQKYIDKINQFIDTIDDKYKTLKYMEERLKINYNKNIGIYNLIQSSGSCTFYSYYLFATNIFLLKTFEKQNNKDIDIDINIDIYINGIINFHYRIIHYFIFTFDQFNIDDYFNYNYIYNLCDKNNLNDDMDYFLSSDKILFRSDRVNSLLENKFKFDIYNQKFTYQKLNGVFMIKFKDIINTVINNIRNTNITDDEIYNQIYPEINDIIKILVENNININKKFIDKFISILKDYTDLYYLYSLILKHTYTNKNIADYTNKIFCPIIYYGDEGIIKNEDNIQYIAEELINNDIFLNLLNYIEINQFFTYMTDENSKKFIKEKKKNKNIHIYRVHYCIWINHKIINIYNNKDIKNTYENQLKKNINIFRTTKFIDYYQQIYKYNRYDNDNNIIIDIVRTQHDYNNKNENKKDNDYSTYNLLNILTKSNLIYIRSNELFINYYYYIFIKLSHIKSYTTVFLVIEEEESFPIYINKTLSIIKSNMWTDINNIHNIISNNLITFNNFEWIKKISNLIVIDTDYNSIIYNNTYYYKKKISSTNISLLKILGRFGISYKNIGNYLIYCNYDNVFYPLLGSFFGNIFNYYYF